MKIRNRELKNRIFCRIQVVASLYAQCSTSEADKHHFKQLLRRKNIQSCLKKKQLLNLFKLKCEWGIRLSGVTKTLFLLTMLIQYQTDK